MNLVLNIDVSGKTGIVTLSREGKHIDHFTNENQMDHAAFLQPAIKQILKKNGLTLQELNAIAVSNGPGSYTGLRVGLAAGKGLAFALQIPLLTISTLELMAKATILHLKQSEENRNIDQIARHSYNDYFTSIEPTFICPIIDARRMEVFFGLYSIIGDEIIPPCNTMVDEQFLEARLSEGKILITGNANEKLKTIINHKNACFIEDCGKEFAFAELSNQLLKQNKIANLANAEPFYCKEFYNPVINTQQ